MSTAKRRSKGDGAVYFHKKSGLWVAQLELPRGLDGKRQRRTVYAATQTQLRRDVADL